MIDNYRILGIDPGSVVCGFGVIEKKGNNIKLIEYGVIKAKKKYDPLPLRLREIFERLDQVIKRTSPNVSAFESMFYAKNVQSLIKLSQARGAAMIAAAIHDLPIHEYSPREVKKSLTGMGNASKEQVSFMVRKLLKIEETPEFYDSTDALAAAICHSLKFGTAKATSSTWQEFIKQNPDRIIRL